MRQLIDFYIDKYFHVAFASVAFSIISAFHFHQFLDLYLIFLIFFSTLFAYHFIGNEMISFKKSTNYLLFFICVGFIAILSNFFFLNTYQFLIWLSIVFISVAYSTPIFWFKNGKIPLRKIPFIKIVIVALVWTLTTVVLPYYFLWKNANFWLEVVQRFLWIIVLIIPFEIKDLTNDGIDLQTIPQIVGINGAKHLGLGILILLLLMNLINSYFFEQFYFADYLILILAGFLISITNKNNSKYHATFWVESIPIVWVLLLFLENLI